MLVGVAPELIGDTAAEMRAISAGRGREEQFVVQGVVRRGRKASLFFLDVSVSVVVSVVSVF